MIQPIKSPVRFITGVYWVNSFRIWPVIMQALHGNVVQIILMCDQIHTKQQIQVILRQEFLRSLVRRFCMSILTDGINM